jgi:hypothetical protein
VQAPNLFLGQCLSAKAENPMVRHNQLPEWQEKSLSRLPDLDTADGVPNARNSTKKGDPCASAIRRCHLSAETEIVDDVDRDSAENLHDVECVQDLTGV